MASEVSRVLTPGAEMLDMGLQALEARVTALENKYIGPTATTAVNDITETALGDLLPEDHPLAGEEKTPVTLLAELVGLMRRHFGDVL